MALAAPINLVDNGSFEDNAVAFGTDHIGAVDGWTGSIETRHGYFGSAEDGLNFAEIDRTFSQTIDTVAGTTYTLSFYYSSRPGAAVSGEGVSYSVGAGDVTLPTLPFLGFDSSQYAAAWALYTTDFTASSGSTTLTFNALGPDDGFGASLDNVSVVVAVPEPGTYALMLAGLAGIAFVARRRTRRL